MRRFIAAGAFLFTAALNGCGGSEQTTPLATTRTGPAMSSSRLAPASNAGPLNAGHGFETLYTFKGGTDGAGPQSRMLHLNGTLFGTTHDGGTSGYGTVYAFDPAKNTETVIYSFQGGADGSGPETGPVS